MRFYILTVVAAFQLQQCMISPMVIITAYNTHHHNAEGHNVYLKSELKQTFESMDLLQSLLQLSYEELC
jgi:hypothetical protein